MCNRTGGKNPQTHGKEVRTLPEANKRMVPYETKRQGVCTNNGPIINDWPRKYEVGQSSKAEDHVEDKKCNIELVLKGLKKMEWTSTKDDPIGVASGFASIVVVLDEEKAFTEAMRLHLNLRGEFVKDNMNA